MAQNMINDSVYVCTDCYMDHHEGRAMKDQSVDWTDNNTDEDGETYTQDFSTVRCECCRTWTAGARHRMAIWEH